VVGGLELLAPGAPVMARVVERGPKAAPAQTAAEAAPKQ